MNKFNLEDYQRQSPYIDVPNYVMYCSTWEQTRAFASYLDSKGLKWRNGESYTDEDTLRHLKYNQGTLMYFNEGVWDDFDEVGDELIGYIVLKFSDFDWSFSEELPFEIVYGEKCAIHCKTIEQNVIVFNQLKDMNVDPGLRKNIGDILFTYIRFCPGRSFDEVSGITVEDDNFYKDKGYKVYGFDDFDWELASEDFEDTPEMNSFLESLTEKE